MKIHGLVLMSNDSASSLSAVEQDDDPVHIEYSGFLWCRKHKETIGKYEGETECEHCDVIVEAPT